MRVEILKFIQLHSLEYRLGMGDWETDLSRGIFFPTDGYVEGTMGPVLIRDIQFIEINLRKKVEFAKFFYHETVDKKTRLKHFAPRKK